MARKPDDCTLPPDTYQKICGAARRALQQADALGRFPTPVDEVMGAASIEISEEDVLDEGFITRWRKRCGAGLKRALSKVLGLFDVRARLVYIDRAVNKVKQTFLKLHELAHGILVWQRDIYTGIEDCKQSLDPEVSERFDREANVFASEVLFQLDSFEREAADSKFGLSTPLSLARRYGASAYSAIRRYVYTNYRPCVVLVLNRPRFRPGDGFVATLRRVVSSKSFVEQFGEDGWPDQFTPDDNIGALVPLGNRRMSRPRRITISDRHGNERPCIAEAFDTTYQVFVLIWLESSLKEALLRVS